METTTEYRVNPKENVYFWIRVLTSIALYGLFTWWIWLSFQSELPAMKSVFILYFYVILIAVFLFIRFGILIGYLKGNAVRLSKNQFPEIYGTVAMQAGRLGLRRVPRVYILQSGGVLNAFAARFLGRNYIILFSEIVEIAEEQDKNILGFVIGHELGHIRRNHMLKNLLLLPSAFIPFLASAYSRACEYTCDNIGHFLCPEGVKSGILVLASGRGIYKKVNIREYIAQDVTEDGFWKWFAEKAASHPNLTKRLALFVKETDAPSLAQPVKVVEMREEDHSRYMPH